MPFPRGVRPTAAALLAAVIVLTGQSVQGAPAAAPPAAAVPPHAPAPLPAAGLNEETAHHHGSTPAAERPPLPASNDAGRRTPDAAPRLPVPRPSARRGRAACAVADFADRTGPALVALVRSADPACLSSLFRLTGADARGVFREAQLASVAAGLRANAADHPGDNSTGTAQLALHLRAGYYVQWALPDVVGAYGPELRAAVRGALDAFFAHPRAFTVSDANGEVLTEVVTLVDSAGENIRYLPVVRRLLAGFDAAHAASWWMSNAVNSGYTVLYRGHWVPGFADAVRRDGRVTAALQDFAAGHLDLLAGDRGYLTANAGRELARFLQHDALRADVRPRVRALLALSSSTGATAPLWVGVADLADEYDRANCADYDVCDLAERLLADVLPIRHTCGPTLRIRAQQMTAAELSGTCGSLTNQDAYFHRIAKDSGPVANDGNTSIEVVVYDSSKDYRTYAGPMWDIDTNNGGMYLEGDPAKAGNQARFIAYEAEWQRPTFQIWNLNHEYTHYLDGRFNMYGDFETNVQTPTVWWIEGFAEYVAYSYRNVTYQEALAEAGKGTYKLSALFDTTYSHDSTRVYRWGYLATRYLNQSHPDDVARVLAAYRTGNWSAARSHLKSTIGTRYDKEWATWLAACARGNCGTLP
ncbi:hypothetical protein GCM10010123_13250 [Pilimelia anulata]|uniref:microbial collagenase n=1 Tax=Pilimelia anulata TaxID=53371 RepID=A0A8J3F9A0_9ACTN|nr:collagenase [Pilimelia anulata]GGJ84935.1 hypothetical protein GCM10010123_13250 [Pilimelia anulata]